MKRNVFGSVIEHYGEKYDLQLNAIYEGLCSPATFSRVMVDGRDIDFLLIETLLARLGIEADEFEFLASDEDYDLWAERLAIKSAMYEKDMEQVRERITYYEGEMPPGQELHRQFVLFYKMKLAEWNREEVDSICAIAEEALALTKKEDMPCVGQNLYTPMELELLFTLMHHRYGSWNETYIIENALRNIVEYVEAYYTVEYMEEIEGRAWMELLRIAEEENNIPKLFEYMDRAITSFSNGTEILRLGQVHLLKAKLLAKLQNTDNGGEDWREQCMEECRMAYSIYQAMEWEEQVREIEEFCQKELQWRITMQMK